MSVNDKKKSSEVKNPELVNLKKEDLERVYKGSADDLLKEMQQEISPEATPLWQYINDHAPKIAAVVIGLVLIIGGYAFYRGYHESNLDDAKQELAMILSKKDSAAVLGELEAFKKSAPSELATAADLEIARFAVQQEDYEKAVKAYEAVMQKEGYSSLGIVSAMNAAGLYAKTGKFAEAVKIYEDIVGHCSEDVQAMVYFQIGEMTERLNQKDKAVKAYQDGIKLFKDVNSADVIFYQSRIKELSK